MEDNQIINLFNCRQESAIKELSDKYGNLCSKIAKNILGNSCDAEECVNDAYLAVWNSVPPTQPESLLAYVCGITRKIAIKKLEYNIAKKRNNYFDLPINELDECLSVTKEEIGNEHIESLLNEFLATIDQKSRIMFVRRYWYEDSISDIAKLFKLRDNTVSVKLNRIRSKLKKFLEERGVLI
ncbi:MAG: sigma-70 family RNA polymerase sigma factor [Lachnospiraceae bacterium]|nr:sigma-70 family RNA polymerase sigma factor [Lachnospiraceae bacterium]